MLAEAAQEHRLFVAGICTALPADNLAKGMLSIHLLSPDEPGFWAHATAQPEFADGQPDPLDRWSARVVKALGAQFGGQALLPFGRPVHPFADWAHRSGRAAPSRVHMLVHGRMGLWASFRGAVALPLPSTACDPVQPCDACPAPCITACPAGAFRPTGFDVAACHGWLDTAQGRDCLYRGCAVRRACPIGQAYGRLEIQSAWHMRQFHR